MIAFKKCGWVAVVVLAAWAGCQQTEPRVRKSARTGQEIYVAMCSRCHGETGQGAAGKHDEALSGDKSVASLAKLIARTMPEDKPGTCKGSDADKVAAYIFDAFYSPAAKARLKPARVELSRLTVPQHQNALADLVGSFRGRGGVKEAGGLAANYYNARQTRNDKKMLARTDAQVAFDWKDASPLPGKLGVEEFSMTWSGSVIAEATGEYEFTVKSENGVRLWVNDMDAKLIDGWVSSRTLSEHRGVISLLGGRAYPLRLEFFKYKDKTASVSLEWKPPGRPREVIPARNLAPQGTVETFVAATVFPADDGSAGYERGIAVSKAWDESATAAAVEAASHVVTKLNELARTQKGAADRAEKAKAFARLFAERAFRRPLTEEQKQTFVDAQFAAAKDVDVAIKRVVLLVLKSPRFLYPELGGATPDDFTIASRLSFGLWDSLPDDELTKAAAAGQLRTSEQVVQQTRRMLADPRARAKLRAFFHEWLMMDEATDVSRDPKTFPGFNDALLADLRTSLELFIENVVWNEGADYRKLLLADYLFLNERLAKFYGVERGAGDGFTKVSFDAKQRAGVLTHPYLLTMFAYYRSSSPIHRGVFLTRNVLGRTLKPPPMAIEFMDNKFSPTLTMREKVSELTRPANCQGCHVIINPLGFSLENYDAVGRYRLNENGKPVNATSEYPTADGKTIRFNGARDVAEHAAANEIAQRGFAEQLFHHIVKQSPDAYGKETMKQLHADFAGSEFNIQKLVADIVKVSALHGIKQ
ncbi:MAG: DUF1592 domain-containing protein [Verrucomicrobia bacterium]|nr:DUF1592 domain-containing protein [Verrucomicrobiota bacterium]